MHLRRSLDAQSIDEPQALFRELEDRIGPQLDRGIRIRIV